MNILKKILVGLLLVVSCGMEAQEEFQEEPKGDFATFRDICIKERESVAANDLDGMASCIAQFREINPTAFASGMYSTSPATVASEFDGHLLFTPEYLEHLLDIKMDEQMVDEDEHTMRVGPTSLLSYAHCLIPANGSCTFSYEGVGYMELLVVCEREQLLDMRIDADAQDFHHQIQSAKSDGIRFHRWTLAGEDVIRVTLTNPTGQAVSAVLLSN